MNKTTLALSLSALGIFGGLATASAEPPCRPPPPPEEAFRACAGESEGTPCSVSFDGHDVRGTCVPFPGRGLVCRPDDMPPPPPAP